MHTSNLIGSWLTVNRNCNFRCKWCYAKETGYASKDDMSLNLAMDLVDLLAELGIQSVILIGGEPTVWKHLFEIKTYIQEKGMLVILVTNGYLFSKDRFLAKVLESPFDRVNVSIKAGNAKQHRELTGTDTFQDVLKGLQNLQEINQPFDISITLSSLVAENLGELVETGARFGTDSISVSFCVPVLEEDEEYSPGYMMHPQEVVNCIMEHYENMHHYTNGNIAIEQSVPFCLWPSEFIELLKERDQIVSGCHVLRRDGVIFDPHGRIIPCNDLHNCTLGQYGKDFHDAETFTAFWESREMSQFYGELTAYPTNPCIECAQFGECGGSCPLQWFVYDPDNLIPERR